MTVALSDLLARLDEIPDQAHQAFEGAGNEGELNQIKARFVGRDGALKEVMRRLRELPVEDRPVLGKAVNRVQQVVSDALEAHRSRIRDAERRRDLERTRVDLTVPVRRIAPGAVHVLRRVERELVDIFVSMGYAVATGPDVETDFNNFGALNFPPDHPARDMQDTLLLTNGHLLRTHTSPVQIRTMLVNRPPIRVIAPGTVYRCDADLTHSPMFTQIEGLLVDTDVSLADLKGTLMTFARRVYGDEARIRLRPSFFPFTEPSCEVDVGCVFCPPSGGCRVCSDTGWIEILGAGMVDPNVFQAVGYDPEAVTGFAFGLGIERVAMLKYGINDIRLFFENDARFLKQFG